ncbi:MAG: hypothetical protein AABY95_05185 [Pseudomonadota bacterium]
MAELLMLAVIGALTASGVVAAYRMQGRVTASEQLIQRSRLRLVELQRVLDRVQRLAAASAVAEGTVEGSTRLVQGVHQGIAAIPFGLLEAIPATRDTAKAVRKTHDFIADGVYDAVSVTNKIVGRVLRGTGKPPDKPES